MVYHGEVPQTKAPDDDVGPMKTEVLRHAHGAPVDIVLQVHRLARPGLGHQVSQVLKQVRVAGEVPVMSLAKQPQYLQQLWQEGKKRMYLCQIIVRDVWL